MKEALKDLHVATGAVGVHPRRLKGVACPDGGVYGWGPSGRDAERRAIWACAGVAKRARL
jgi:hypothetical protein